MSLGQEWNAAIWRGGFMLHKNAKKKPQGCGFLNCGTTGIRTWDTRIFNPLLYQLSYGTSNEGRIYCIFSSDLPV